MFQGGFTFVIVYLQVSESGYIMVFQLGGKGVSFVIGNQCSTIALLTVLVLKSKTDVNPSCTLSIHNGLNIE